MKKLTRKHKAALICTCAVLLAGMITGIILYFTVIRERTENVEDLSDDIVMITTNRGTRIVNKETNTVLISDINPDWTCYSDDDSIAVFAIDKLRGYFNYYTGELIVPATYRRAWIFSEGLAGVEQDGKIGFINRRGEVVIPIEIPAQRGSSYVFHHHHCVIPTSNDKAGVIDTLGNWVIEPMYDYVYVYDDFFIVANKGELEKKVDLNGNILADNLFDDFEYIEYYENYINKETGEPSRTTVYHPTICKYSVNGRYGLMTKTGKFVTPPLYRSIQCLGKDFFVLSFDYYSTSIIVDPTGQIIK